MYWESHGIVKSLSINAKELDDVVQTYENIIIFLARFLADHVLDCEYRPSLFL